MFVAIFWESNLLLDRVNAVERTAHLLRRWCSEWVGRSICASSIIMSTASAAYHTTPPRGAYLLYLTRQ